MFKCTHHFIGISQKLALFILFVLITQVASGGSNTASFTSTGSGEISIVGFRDVAGAPIMVPPGFDIFPSTVGPNQGVLEESGSGILTFAGTAGVSGSGASTMVSISSNLGGTAVPAGVADGVETVTGAIQFINNSAHAVEVTVRFSYDYWAGASVTDPVLETVSDVFYNVEFQEATGGDPNSPCTGGLLVDEDMFGLGAPPDDITPAIANFLDRSVTIPEGANCIYTALVQTGGKAMAIAPLQPAAIIPTLGLWGAALLVLGLLLVGIRRMMLRKTA